MEDRKSTSSCVFSLDTGAVTWTSKKQHVVSLFVAKEKYQAAVKVACEIVWLRQMLGDMKILQNKPTLL